MTKYNIILLASQCNDFLDTLRNLGMVDITTSGWEASENDRELLSSIDCAKKAIDFLNAFAKSENYISGAKDNFGKTTAIEAYKQIQAKITAANAEITKLQKTIDIWGGWGNFDTTTLSALSSSGISLRYFVTSSSTFEKNETEWSQAYNIFVVDNSTSLVRFVIIGANGEVNIDATELKAPTISTTDAQQELEQQKAIIKNCNVELSTIADRVAEIESYLSSLEKQLQDIKIEATADKQADNMLLTFEGWCEKENESHLDTTLNNYPNVVFIKSKPTPEDNTPVKLKNNCFARMFELIGSMYALPKYGTIDLTPFFSPFYMLFFAICLCDAGYGAVILAAGIALMLKGGKSLRQAALLSTTCGVACVIFGFFANSFFGMSISAAPIFANFHGFIDFKTDFFMVSMIIGIIQILLGMAINIFYTAHTFGFKYCLGSLGWFLLLFCSCMAFICGKVGFAAYGFDSIAYMISIIVAIVLMLLLNNPEKNIFANVGLGLWNTYNSITGLLSDVLSYIRLFAIGLSGGVLALVFNQLALGLTGLDSGVEGQSITAIILKIVGASIILLIGHGINLFMSAISSFVHPMRLTFVEFFKNAGFEMATREFNPLKNKQ